MNQNMYYEDQQNFHSLSNKSVRMSFIRKVLTILLVQLSFTTVFIALVHNVPSLAIFYLKYRWLSYVSIGVSLLTLIIIYCTN